MKKASRHWAIICCVALIIQMITFTPVTAAPESAGVTFELATTIEAGEKYVIVSNGQALTNEVASVSTANGGSSLASTVVTVADGKITSEVADTMIWDFTEGTSSLAGPYETGFFLTNGESKFLSRGSSGGAGVAPLNTSAYDAGNVSSKPHYCYWAFDDLSEDGATKSMFLFSSNSSDYVFFMRGADAGFDAPGTSQDNMVSSLANYPVQLYKVTVSEPEPEPESAYALATTVEAGEKYVIVSNGYALTNEVDNDVPTANTGVSLASTSVTVADGKITSDVADTMIWDFSEGTSAVAGSYTTGFFITNGESKYLSRGSSGGAGVAPLKTDAYDAENVATKPHYCYWAFDDISADGATKSMFLFSSNSSDYVFFMRGAAEGFDAPGTSQDNMASSLANYPVQLYKATAVSNPDPEPETSYELSATVKAGKKYIIVSNGYALTNETASVPVANTGVSLASTAVTVEEGKITSEVLDTMIWDFAEGASNVSGPYTTGFFITNGDSMFLSRASSGRVGVAPLNTNTYDYDNVETKPHYSYWSFLDLSEDGTTKAMFMYNITGTEYVFYLRGAEVGFDAPGDLKEFFEEDILENPMQLFEVKTGDDIEDPEDPEEPEPGDSVLIRELLFMSDTHSDMTGSVPNFTNVRAILPLLKESDINPSVISFGGDYLEDDKAYLVNWENVYSTLTGVLTTTYPDADYAFTTGNHDKETNGGISDAEFKRIFGFDRVGVSYVSDECEIFHIGAQGNGTTGVDKEIFYEEDIQALDTYLAGKVGSEKVILVQTHWPLHRAYNWSWRNIANAGSLIDTLNTYGDDLDIVFLWGHNHYTDNNRLTIKKPGDSILYADNANKTIKFTYANVGVMNDMFPNQTGRKETTVGPGVCLSVNILNDKLVLTYNRVTGGNTATPVLTHDANITIDGTYYPNPATTEITLLNPFSTEDPEEPEEPDPPSEYPMTVFDVVFTPDKLSSVTSDLSASAKVTNTSDTEQDCMVIIAIYDDTNAMINYSYVGKTIGVNKTENLTAGFRVPFEPGESEGYTARVYVWDGLHLSSTEGIPMSAVHSIAD